MTNIYKMIKLTYMTIMVLALFNPMETVETDKMINCYYGSWNHNDHFGKHLEPEEINPYLCTHISYGFFGLAETGKVVVLDVTRDLMLGYLDHTLALKWRNPELKIIAVVGGPSVASKRFSNIVASPMKRSMFRYSILTFIQANGFDGVDIHWLYPGSEKIAGDYENIVTLLSELKDMLTPLKLELGITVSGKVSIARNWYDIPNIAKNVDYINVMAYNYTSGNRITHDAPLFGRGDNNIEATINHWIDKGAPPSKLNLGVAFVAHSYILWDSQDIRTDTAPDSAWPFSSIEPEFKSYGQVCHIEYTKLVLNTSFGFDGEVGASFVQDQVTWTSYESPRSLEMKMDFVLEERLRGVMVWSLQNDDYLGKCYEKYSMLQIVNRKLDKRFQCQPKICCMQSKHLRSFCFNIEKGQFLVLDNPLENPSSYWPLCLTDSEVSPPMQTMKSLAYFLITSTLYTISETVDTDKMVNCYYNAGSYFRRNDGKFTPQDIDPYLCTHISYGFFGISENGTFIYSDTRYDPKPGARNYGISQQQKLFSQDLIRRTIDLKWKNPKLKVIAVLGGYQMNLPQFLGLENKLKFRNFRDSMAEFLVENSFDGFDIHLRTDLKDSNQIRRDTFSNILQLFKKGFENNGLLFGITVSGRVGYAREFYDINVINEVADYINILTFNYTNDKWATHDAPLYGVVEENINNTIQYWLQKGVPASKINMGVALIGRSFEINPSAALEFKLPAIGPGISGSYTNESSYISYMEMCQIRQRIEKLDPKASATDITDGGSVLQFRNYWWTYENCESLEMKLNYLQEMKLGGIVIWSLENDDFRGLCGSVYPLMHYIDRKLDDRFVCTTGRCCIKSKNIEHHCYDAY
ncbi:putative chitinase 10 [Haematobia irritans]|uniref:putative chitinase 10 n=1 Tax=Haematobia irritans TaxID=7368 RepID=UPI003F4F6B67